MAIWIPLLRRFSENKPVRSNSLYGWVRPYIPYLILTYAVLVPFQLPARGTDESEAKARYDLLQELNPQDVTYRVVPGAIVAPEIPDNRRTALGGYLRIVRDIIANVPVRYLSEAERRAIIVGRVTAERNRILSAIDQRLVELDTEAMRSSTDDGAVAADNRSTDRELENVRRRLDILDSLPMEAYSVSSEVELTIPEDQEYLVRGTLHDPHSLATAAEADIYVYIEVNPLDDLYILGVYMYVPGTETHEEVLRIVAPPDEIPLRLEEYGRRIVYAVAAKEVADVTLTAIDAEGRPIDDARIFLDGMLMGIGSVRDEYVPAGYYRVRGVTPDGRERLRYISVAPGEVVEHPLLITSEPRDFVTVSTVPPEASVYRGVEWIGYTPLQIPQPDTMTSFTLVKEDYYDSRIELGPETTGDIVSVLVSQDYDWQQDTRVKRDRFYRSFGWFSLSVGVPIILYGAYQDYMGLFPGGVVRSDLSADEGQRISREGMMIYYGYYGSIALSAGLFGNMIWRLVDYIRTAQGYHTR